MTVEAPSGAPTAGAPRSIQDRETITVRFAGDSGDGMQQTGLQFTNTSAIFGNDVSTLPDFPAEIRAPAGTVYGVSGFQVNFSAGDIHTPGDDVDCLVAMNPAALKVNIGDLTDGGILIVNTDGFTASNLKMAGYESNPLDDSSLEKYLVYRISITEQNRKALEEFDLKTKQIDLCKNYYALGVVCWLFNRPLKPIEDFLKAKFAKKPIFIDANMKALKSGFYFGETAELFTVSFRVAPAALKPGKYRQIGGNVATALGFIAAAQLADKPLFYGSYPITPATDILHELARHKEFDVRTFQAEDEIAAMTSVIGAAFAGALSVTATSGPGLALKGEALGLAVMTELPMVIVDVQRGGPSTGLPTKTEAADLLQAVVGRNGECPLVVLAASTPSDCFDMAIEASRIAIRHMLPVILLTDGYLGNGAEPWLIPDVSKLEKIKVEHPGDNAEGYQPYNRNEFLARPWAIPGTKGLQHRLGGLEKNNITGNVSYDPENHQAMCELRQKKVDYVADFIPELEVFGEPEGKLLILGWGGTRGAILQATERALRRGQSVACAHLHHLNPFPKNLGDVLSKYEKVLIPELNLGQLRMMIRAKYLIDAIGLNKVKGRPFHISEITLKIDELLGENK